MREIEGVAPPRREEQSCLFVRWPTLKVPLAVTLLGEVPLGLAMHWVMDDKAGKGVSRPCLKPDPCPHCGNSLRDGWNGFLPALSHGPGVRIILPFTRDAWVALSSLARDGEPVRGMRLRLERGGGKENGPYIIKREEQTWPQKTWPACPDIRPALRALYGDLPQLRERAVSVSDENGGAQ